MRPPPFTQLFRASSGIHPFARDCLKQVIPRFEIVLRTEGATGSGLAGLMPMLAGMLGSGAGLDARRSERPQGSDTHLFGMRSRSRCGCDSDPSVRFQACNPFCLRNNR